jgi:transcription elongation factor GreA
MNGSDMEFLLGSAEIAEGSDIEVYSPDSPIGTAILGAKVGDTVSFFAPNGKEREIKILEVKNFLG